jgi:hypothetical protein
MGTLKMIPFSDGSLTTYSNRQHVAEFCDHLYIAEIRYIGRQHFGPSSTVAAVGRFRNPHKTWV